MSCLLALRPLALSRSLQDNNSSSPPSPAPQPNVSAQPLRRKTTTIPKTRQRITPQQKRPSVQEIERAIGTGMFKDRNPRETEENATLFDGLLPRPGGIDEGSVEKKLRETGEWLVNTSERSSSSAGKRILIGLFLLIVPLGILMSIASGAVKLPFSSPFLDDLLM